MFGVICQTLADSFGVAVWHFVLSLDLLFVLGSPSIAAGLKLENMPEEFGSISNVSKKINSNRCSVDFLVAFLKACGCRLVIESQDGTRTPVNPEDVPPLVLGKRRVGTGRPKKGK